MEHKPCIYKCPTNLRIVSHNYPLKQGAKTLQIWPVQSDKSVAKKFVLRAILLLFTTYLKPVSMNFERFF